MILYSKNILNSLIPIKKNIYGFYCVYLYYNFGLNHIIIDNRFLFDSEEYLNGIPVENYFGHMLV